jgi:hypothetical protein
LTPLWRGGQFVGEVLDYIGLATLAYGVLRWGLKGIAGRFARGCAFSFAAGTLVATPSGLVPIETIEVGDQVLCKDEQTGVESVCAVTRTFDHVAPTTLALTLESADQSRELVVTTSEHPFYGTGFSAAGHLRAGDVVLGSGDQLLEVADARWDQTGQAVFNLSVESGRSFFVGESGAWVHNCPASGGRGTFGFSNPTNRANSIVATLEDGVLHTAIEATGPGRIRGSELFNRAVDHFGRDSIHGVAGSWTYGGNLATFNRLTGASISAAQAARGTFTGIMAGRLGFTTVDIVALQGDAFLRIGFGRAFTRVEVLFR